MQSHGIQGAGFNAGPLHWLFALVLQHRGVGLYC